MHLATRNDEDQGRTRTVVWTDGSTTDLGVLAAASIAGTACAVSVVVAVEIGGVAQVVAVVLAIVSGLYAAAMIVPLLVVLVGVFVVKGLAAKKPSTAQRASWVVVAAVIGALLGSLTYGVGVPGLLIGPIVVAIVVAVLGTTPALSPRSRRRELGLSGVVAAAAICVGLTIFL